MPLAMDIRHAARSSHGGRVCGRPRPTGRTGVEGGIKQRKEQRRQDEKPPVLQNVENYCWQTEGNSKGRAE
jgi:hypothetical protein